MGNDVSVVIVAYGVDSLPANPLCPACPSLLCPLSHWQPPIHLVFVVLPFPESHRVGIRKDLAFLGRLLSLSGIRSSFLHVCSWFNSSFVFSAELYSTVWMDYSFLVLSPTEGHFGCFQV